MGNSNGESEGGLGGTRRPRLTHRTKPTIDRVSVSGDAKRSHPPEIRLSLADRIGFCRISLRRRVETAKNGGNVLENGLHTNDILAGFTIVRLTNTASSPSNANEKARQPPSDHAGLRRLVVPKANCRAFFIV